MSDNMQFVVGVDLGGTNVRASVVDSTGKILSEARMDSKAMEGLDATLGQLVKTVRQAVASSPVGFDSIKGVGIGIPGTIRNATGVVDWNPNFKGWDGVQVRKPLFDELGVSIQMGNDANVAALGEYTFGAGQGSKIMVMLTLGTGIGSGLIIDGKSFTGVTDCAPELGHHIIDVNGPQCGCGKFGCLESLTQRDAICQRAQKKAHMGRATSLLEKSNHDLRYITPRMIAEAAAEGDEVSIETLAETGYYLGIGVSNIINIINPDKLVIGGGISAAGDLLFAPMRRTVEVNAIYGPLTACEIVPAMLGDDAGVLGGAAMALQGG